MNGLEKKHPESNLSKTNARLSEMQLILRRAQDLQNTVSSTTILLETTNRMLADRSRDMLDDQRDDQVGRSRSKDFCSANHLTTQKVKAGSVTGCAWPEWRTADPNQGYCRAVEGALWGSPQSSQHVLHWGGRLSRFGGRLIRHLGRGGWGS